MIPRCAGIAFTARSRAVASVRANQMSSGFRGRHSFLCSSSYGASVSKQSLLIQVRLSDLSCTARAHLELEKILPVLKLAYSGAFTCQKHQQTRTNSFHTHSHSSPSSATPSHSLATEFKLRRHSSPGLHKSSSTLLHFVLPHHSPYQLYVHVQTGLCAGLSVIYC